MDSELQSQITTILEEIRAGDAQATDRLVQLVYSELRDIAGKLMRQERSDHSLWPTEIVHEALVRLLAQDALAHAHNRRYFFAAAARAMRHILVDHARRRNAPRHGGDRVRVPFDCVLESYESPGVDLVALDDALQQLAAQSQRQSEIVTLRFFGGMTQEEIAEHLGISVSTVEREFRFARAYLRRTLLEKE